MAYVISDDCISCGTCAGECPVGAISEGDGKFEINADECLDCGSCAAACPTGAISQESCGVTGASFISLPVHINERLCYRGTSFL